MKPFQNASKPTVRIELKGILSEFREALEEEIDKIEKSGQSSTLLFSGRQIESHGADFWYRFNVEYAPVLPADTPCKLVVGKDFFDVTVISFEESSVVVSSKVTLPETIGKARLENGATVLMKRLIKCIEENSKKENPAGNRMLSTDDRVYAAKKIFNYGDLALKNSNTDSQNNAIRSALTNDITYIWGPPGTGKTTVIGQIVDELYKHNRSVLVVSHTNTAVDGAIEKADETYFETTSSSDVAYPILRMGIPTKKSLPERVLLEHHIALLGKELYDQKKLLEKQQSDLQHRVNEIRLLLAKGRWLSESQLEDVRNKLQNIDAYKKEIEKIQRDIDVLSATMAQVKATNPEYSKYLVLSKTLKEKRQIYEDIRAQIREMDNASTVLSQRIQSAIDEVGKHDRYAALQAQEAKCMSEPFLKAEISKATEKIANLQSTIDYYLKQQATAKQTISDYEKKPSIAKLLSNKNIVNLTQATLTSIQRELPGAEDDLHLQENRKLKYCKQLEELLLLQEEMRRVFPSRTQEFWSDEVDKLQTEFSATRKALADFTAHEETIYAEICNLEHRQEEAKPSFERLSELGRQQRQEQNRLAAMKKLYDRENAVCSELLEQEFTFCSAFFQKPTSKNITSLLVDLASLFDRVKAELSSIDFDVLQQEKDEADRQLTEIFRQLDELKQKMQELEKQAIMKAKIVGTTLAKAYLSETLRERKFDTVILDEASMASIPALWCASYLAECNIVIVGDFLQLPPIVMAETPMAKKWLGKDIFYHSRMQELSRSKATCPANFIMLNTQFRMESDIADVANMYYGSHGGLISDDQKESRVKDRETFYSWYSGKKTKRNVHLIDTETLHAWVTGVPQGKSHSRLNCFSAVVSVDLAFKFLENRLKMLDPKTAGREEKPAVLIVAPYKPHIARINQLIELEYRNRGFKENLNLISAGTIHSFQGSEADIVIFDLVIDEPHWKANLFMTDKEINEDLEKMFNVAITRAKFKLYIVGNFAYCQKRAKDNALSRLLDKLIKGDRLAKIDAKTLLPDIVYARQPAFAFDGNLSGKHIVCREEVFNDYFLADIHSFKKRLIVYSAFITEARLSTLLPSFTDAIRAGKQIIVVTKAISDRSKSEVAQYIKCEKELYDIGVSVLHKKGMHEKLIFVDSNAVWIGSLNALSFTGLTGEVMQRHADRELTAEYENLFNIEHICSAIENTYEQKCPICGKEMLMRESDEGGIYWQCDAGDYSRNVTQQYPVDGILRCKCGALYTFAMKNEPRWVCSEDSRHYQKMRESDLRLDKMAALIPTKAARREVDKYFATKKKELSDKKKATVRNKTSSKKKLSNESKDKDDPMQMKLF